MDAIKVLMGEPWTFDRHLVFLERYDSSTQIQNLQFKTTSYWVQIHDLPFSYLSNEVALSAVTVPKYSSEMRGGNFMRVRVAVDITKAFCRGGRVSWSLESEGWVSFKYELLPNLCYWCGQLRQQGLYTLVTKQRYVGNGG